MELRLWVPLGAGVSMAVVLGSVVLPVGTGALTVVVVGSALLPVEMVAPAPVELSGWLEAGLPAGHVKPPIEPLSTSRDGAAVSAVALRIS
jgi:hypothetical protein